MVSRRIDITKTQRKKDENFVLELYISYFSALVKLRGDMLLRKQVPAVLGLLLRPDKVS